MFNKLKHIIFKVFCRFLRIVSFQFSRQITKDTRSSVYFTKKLLISFIILHNNLYFLIYLLFWITQLFLNQNQTSTILFLSLFMTNILKRLYGNEQISITKVSQMDNPEIDTVPTDIEDTTNFNCNQIIAQYIDESQSTVYLPTYISLKIKNIAKMELGDLNADLNVVVVIRIYFGNLPKLLRDQIWEKVIINFSRDDPFTFNMDEDDEEYQQKTVKKFNQVEKYRQFKIKRVLSARIAAYTFFTPFQILDLIISFQLRKIKFLFSNDNSEYCFMAKLNIMNAISTQQLVKEEQQIQKMIHYSQTNSFGAYEVAKSFLCVHISNQHRVKPLVSLQKNMYKLDFLSGIQPDEVKKKEKKLKRNKKNPDTDEQEHKPLGSIDYFQYAYFHVPVFKHPFVGLATIYIPLFLLSCINLTLFYSDNNFNERVAGASTMTLALVAMIPTIRDQVPLGNKITYIEFMVYLQIVVTFLLLIESWLIRLESGKTQERIRTSWFVIASAITIITSLSPVFQYIYFKFFIAPKFDFQESSDKQNYIFDSFSEPEFRRHEWSHNKQCQKYFKPLLDRHQFIVSKSIDKQLSSQNNCLILEEDAPTFNLYLQHLEKQIVWRSQKIKSKKQ